MAHLTREALAHFETHHGIASLAQLEDLGVGLHAVKRLNHLGNIEQVLQGAYRLRGVPLTELGRCAAVCIAHPESAIAGPTAGRLWNFRRIPPDLRIHTLSPPHSHPTVAPWVNPYRTAAFHPEDVIRRNEGIVVTSRPRTALDLGRYLSSIDQLSVIEQAMRDGGHSIEEMRRVAVDWISPQRPWLGRYLELLDRRLDGGEADSHPETLVGDALVRAGVRGLVRQHSIELPGYGRARFDLAVPELQWAIEVDVFPTHQETAGRRSDEQRDLAALGLGWRVTRLDEAKLGAALDSTIADLIGLYENLKVSHRLRQTGGER